MRVPWALEHIILKIKETTKKNKKDSEEKIAFVPTLFALFSFHLLNVRLCYLGQGGGGHISFIHLAPFKETTKRVLLH